MESKGDRFLTYVGTAGLVMIGLFGFAWLATGNANIAALLVIVVGFAVAMIGSGMYMMYLGNRAIIDRLTDALMARGRDQLVAGDYALRPPALLSAQPPPRFLRQPDGILVNRDVLLQDAAKILRLRDAGFPAPRRALIEQQLGTTDHERIARAMNYLSAMGYVTPAKDGGKREWVSPTEGDHE